MMLSYNICHSFLVRIGTFCLSFFFFLLSSFFFSSLIFSQSTFPVNGVHDENHNYSAFTNAVIFIDYKTKIDSATLLIRDEKIVKTGKNIDIPENTVVYDLQGKYIYPSFIDIYSNYGMPEVKRKPKEPGEDFRPQMERTTKGAVNWNEAIKPEVKAASMFSVNKKEAEEMRNLGFGAVLTHQKDGIARGTSTLVTLAEEKENEVMLNDNVAAHYSFNKGTSTQNYPSSQMGSIALLRQTYYDAQWYKENFSNPKSPEGDLSNPSQPGLEAEFNISLDYFNKNQNLAQIFEADDYLSVLRADKVGDEFGAQYIIKGTGDEYKRLKEIKETKVRLIVPLKFPKNYDVEDAYDALLVSLDDMKHWELAPANLAMLEKESIEFALTSSDLENKKSFWKNLLKAKKYGLSDTTALKSLTLIPAKILNAEDKIGALKTGMLANFIICSDSLFSLSPMGKAGEGPTIYENWIQGKRYIISDYNTIDVRGDYDLNINSFIYELKVEGKPESPNGKLKISGDTNKIKVNISVYEKLISLSFELNDKNYNGLIRLSGKINYQSGSWDGQGQVPNGKWISWNAIRKEKFKEKPDTTKIDSVDIGKIFFPNMAFGTTDIPVAKPTLIKNATVWTNEKEGILANTDVFLTEGKITKIGKNLEEEIRKGAGTAPVTSYVVIDGTNKHLSAGIIDEHSHIAISRGVNEGAQAVSAEVRIGDVINPDDINIYRQLAGGVTAAQLLHGSANPIGGQSALIKLKWGFAPEEMKIKNGDGFIKFALGENVKQSNWGDFNTVRFPQTRMGVEQVYLDAFTRTKEYANELKKFNSFNPKKNKVKPLFPRRDLELDALSEILNKKRFITCHSYIQSEINMLMHVADSMGFKVNTFTHILEGYKVADKMKKHGVGASSFSDWWAYKFEVNDAIPYNGAILHEQGITVAFNSDDAEMGRRLNQEAGKAVKYGVVPEEEALKFVTLNPAKLLHLDNRMGSIKPGKDADVVLWSDNPLSIYAKAEKTFVDGLLLYDMEQDKILREEIQRERVRIISKMLKAKKAGEETQKAEKKENKLYHCDTVGE